MKKLIPNGSTLIPGEAEKVFSGVIYDVYQWQQKMFDNSRATFEMLRRPDTVSIVGIVDQKLITINDRQPHTGTKRNFPGGRVDVSDSSTLVAAKREMLEETGYEFANWRLVKVAQPVSKIEWFIFYFVAWNGHRVAEQNLDAGEQITVDLLEFNEFKQLAEEGIGDLGELNEMLGNIDSVAGLMNLPTFEGQEVTIEP